MTEWNFGAQKSLPYIMDQKFRMDRTAFKAMTAAEADDHVTYWKDKSPRERLEAACYLINQAYGTTPQTKLDRTIFSKRKRETATRVKLTN